eukprot:COSAG05_NODE_528_length_8915_cov_26.504651_6_plen_74_part_00
MLSNQRHASATWQSRSIEVAPGIARRAQAGHLAACLPALGGAAAAGVARVYTLHARLLAATAVALDLQLYSTQ